MLLQYGHSDLNGDNCLFGKRAKDQPHKNDYPHGADKTDTEARQVLAAEMILRQISWFDQPKVHTILILNVFKYMAFKCMQESIRSDRR